jgi:cell division protein FtsW (lipid II flippase)
VKESLTALPVEQLRNRYGQRKSKTLLLLKPEQNYVYTVFGEEWGFVGALIVFGIHCFLFFRCFWMAHSQENRFLEFLGVGLAMNIFL